MLALKDQQPIVLASSNKGKIAEFSAILDGLDCRLIPLSHFSTEEAEETGKTFVENAILKARHACHISQLPAMADDSGIVVDALGGEPGIFSARYAGEKSDSEANIQKLLKALHSTPEKKRTAHFYCTIVFLRYTDDPEPVICHGRWDGLITTEKRGAHGFGYDPVFYVPEYHCAAAELDISVKNQISHRARALAELKRYFFV